jgi:hypothetical protein
MKRKSRIPQQEGDWADQYSPHSLNAGDNGHEGGVTRKGVESDGYRCSGWVGRWSHPTSAIYRHSARPAMGLSQGWAPT